MAVTKADFARLFKLQEHDNLLDDLRKKLLQIPEDIEALKSEVAGERDRLSAAQQATKDLLVQKKHKENEMAQKEEAIKKHQTELNAVKTNDAFKALLKEIDAAKKGAGELETEILEMMDTIDASGESEKKAKDELTRAETENNKSVKVLEDKKAAAEKNLADEDAKRAALTDGIDSELTDLYEQTRKRREGVAVALLENDSCSVCHTKAPPQFIIDATKGTKITQCDACTRILVLAQTASA
jgi:predicted  nucleic acid-binding Zn-ribbon protein